MSDDFVQLHVHSDFSKLDGLGRTEAYLRAAVDAGQPAMATTEHGTMRGVHEMALKSKGLPIKPIYGIEFYVAKDMRRRGLTDAEKEDVTRGLKKSEHRAAIKRHEEREGVRDRWHLTAWAKNDDGIKNLYRLSSKAWLEGFYYQPRIDLQALAEHREGVVVSTGCLNSPINDRVVGGKRTEALEVADGLREVFGNDLWIEVQPHVVEDGGRRLQEEANRFALELAERWGTSHLLATQDAHYVGEHDHDSHEVLLCIGTGANLSDTDRFKFSGTDFCFRTREQMRDAFEANHPYMGAGAIKLALDNTLALAEGCSAKVVLDPLRGLMPVVEVPGQYEGNEFEYLKALCLEGWRWREVAARAEKLARRKSCPHADALRAYKDRLKKELTVLREQKFVGYFLIVRDLYEWVRRRGIMCGPGRGSAAGSLISFLLGITSVDPIEHELLFERFIGPGRVDLPDIDMDFPDYRRGEILSYLREKYGSDRVCQIATVGRLAGKQCVKDVCRVLGVPFNESNAITDLIMAREPGDDRLYNCVEDSFAENDELRRFGERYPDVLKHARVLEGTAKSLGIHAAGVVLSPVPLVEVVPLETRKQSDAGDGDKVVVSALDMKGVADFGLVKMDILGLRTLSVIGDVVAAVKNKSVALDMENLPLDDAEVLGGFTRRDFVGVFQFDSAVAERGCEGVEFTAFDDIAAFTSLVRPGPAGSGLLDEWKKRKRDPSLVDADDSHPKIKEITRSTLGVLTYQEQVMRIMTDLAGWTAGEADKFRKLIGKRVGIESLEKERKHFLDGVGKTTPDMDASVADEFFSGVTTWGSYGFNYSHAVAYGVIAYWCMWLKVHYPTEFFWALMKHEPDVESVQHVASDARRHGVDLYPPDINVSRVGFTIDGTAVRGSILDIKGIGEAAAAEIIAGQPYASVGDFLARTSRRRVNRKTFEVLARSGALDSIVPNVRWVLDNLEDLWGHAASCGDDDFSSALVDGMVEAARGEPSYSPEERSVIAASVRPSAFGDDPIDVYGRFVSEHVRVPLADPSREDFWSANHGRGTWVVASVEDHEVKQVGDHHDGDASDEEKARMGWGKRFSTFVLRGKGFALRSKLGWESYEAFDGEVTAHPGAPVLALVTPDKKYANARARAVVSLESFRRGVFDRRPPSLWERVASGWHPADSYPWPSEERAASVKVDVGDVLARAKKAGAKARVVALVTSVVEKPDKRGNQMGFVGLLGWRGWVDARCFSSVWPSVREAIQPGRLFEFELDVKDGALITGGHVMWLKKGSTT